MQMAEHNPTATLTLPPESVTVELMIADDNWSGLIGASPYRLDRLVAAADRDCVAAFRPPPPQTDAETGSQDLDHPAQALIREERGLCTRPHRRCGHDHGSRRISAY